MTEEYEAIISDVLAMQLEMYITMLALVMRRLNRQCSRYPILSSLPSFFLQRFSDMLQEMVHPQVDKSPISGVFAPLISCPASVL